jgi:ABC-type multidrug transport system ATPase subunit
VTPLLEARGLAKRFGARTIFSRVDLTLREREITGLVGSNGAGKTTLLRTLLGFMRASAGEVARSVPPGALEHFGGAPTIPPHLSARTWVRLCSRGSAACDDPRPIRTLSRGSRQILGLSTVLARREARAFLLDEPWEGLDPDGSRWLSKTLRERRDDGCAFLVSSHRLYDLAGLCGRYAFLVNGRVTLLTSAEIGEHVGAVELVRAFDLLRGSP